MLGVVTYIIGDSKSHWLHLMPNRLNEDLSQTHSPILGMLVPVVKSYQSPVCGIVGP